VAQGGGTDPALSAREELVLQGRLYGLSKAESQRRSAELLQAFELTAAAERPTGTYSGGQRRRLDLALGLIHRPRLVFLDEPTTGLDPQGRARMWDEVRRLRDGGMTVFLTTHYLEEADALCDRLAIIDHGRIVADGTADQLKRQVAGDLVTLTVQGDPVIAEALLAAQPFVRESSREAATIRLYVEQGEAALPAILRLLDGADLPLQTIALSRPSLDDVFLRTTGHSLRDDAN
jgi:ABC-2 type transport system ATP-binding protein